MFTFYSVTPTTPEKDASRALLELTNGDLILDSSSSSSSSSSDESSDDSSDEAPPSSVSTEEHIITRLVPGSADWKTFMKHLKAEGFTVGNKDDSPSTKDFIVDTPIIIHITPNEARICIDDNKLGTRVHAFIKRMNKIDILNTFDGCSKLYFSKQIVHKGVHIFDPRLLVAISGLVPHIYSPDLPFPDCVMGPLRKAIAAFGSALTSDKPVVIPDTDDDLMDFQPLTTANSKKRKRQDDDDDESDSDLSKHIEELGALFKLLQEAQDKYNSKALLIARVSKKRRVSSE